MPKKPAPRAVSLKSLKKSARNVNRAEKRLRAAMNADTKMPSVTDMIAAIGEYKLTRDGKR